MSFKAAVANQSL